MRLVIEKDGEWVPLPYKCTLRRSDGVRISSMAIRMPSWSDEDRKAFGVYRVRPVEVPSGKRVRYRQLKRVDDEVVEVGEFYDAPSRGVWVDRIKK